MISYWGLVRITRIYNVKVNKVTKHRFGKVILQLSELLLINFVTLRSGKLL